MVNERNDSGKDIFWADKLAKCLVKRKKFNYINKEIPKLKEYVIKSSTSLSGVPHIGNASDVIRHDALVRALKDIGKKVKFLWVSEDMDPLRKVPKNIPEGFKKYLGMPVSDIPCPEGCCKSYSYHFSKLFFESLKDFGTNPDYKSTSESYRNGEFTKWIVLAMKNVNKIREIWNKSRKSKLNEKWTPWQPVCENCGKIITTNVISYDDEHATYICKDYSFREFGKKAYTKVKGCGHKGISEFKKGDGKLLWRVEWAMLWSAWKVVFEGAGKEHFMPGGSFWTAGEISEKIFNWPEPYPCDNPLQPYEYITVDGEKMSASKGNVVATWEWPTFAPPQVLRLLFLKKMRKVRDFSYKKIPDYVDEYDTLQRIYFGAEKVDNEKEEQHLKRLYEMVETEMPDKLPVQIPFSFAAVIAQISKIPNKNNLERAIDMLKATNHITTDLNDEDKKIIEKRLNMAYNWVMKFAPEHKITVNDKVPQKIKEKVKNEIPALKELARALTKEMSEEELYKLFFDLCKKHNINTKKFFRSAYQVLISKDSGPRLAPFILALGKERVRKILEQL